MQAICPIQTIVNPDAGTLTVTVTMIVCGGCRASYTPPLEKGRWRVQCPHCGAVCVVEIEPALNRNP